MACNVRRFYYFPVDFFSSEGNFFIRSNLTVETKIEDNDRDCALGLEDPVERQFIGEVVQLIFLFYGIFLPFHHSANFPFFLDIIR